MFDSSTRSFDFPGWHATRISWFSRGIKTSPGFRPPAIHTGPGTRRDFRRLLRDEEFPSRLQPLAFPNFQPLDLLFLPQRTPRWYSSCFLENDAREYSRLFIADTLWIDRSVESDLMSTVSRVSWLELFSWNWLNEELVYNSFLLNFFWKSYFIPRNGECLVKCIILFNLLLNSFRFTHPQQNSPFLKYYHFLFVSLDKLFQQNFPSFHPGIFAAIQEISKSLSRYVLPNNEDTYSHTEGGIFLAHALAALLAFPEGVEDGGASRRNWLRRISVWDGY